MLENPTAAQVAAEVQARPIRRLGPWLGVAWRCQAVPSQCSARVWMPPEAFNQGGFTMPKEYWDKWLQWTSAAGMW